MNARWVSACAIVIIVLGGFGTLSWATEGWTVWTAESARRHAILSQGVSLPDFRIHGPKENRNSLHEFEKPLLIVNFIFTRCPTVCIAMGYKFRQLQSQLVSAGLTDETQLLSISFDHEYDDAEQLANYLQRYTADPINWSAIRIVNKEDLSELLTNLGVIVIPDEQLGYIHNAATLLVQNKEIVGIFDVNDTGPVLESIYSRVGLN